MIDSATALLERVEALDETTTATEPAAVVTGCFRRRTLAVFSSIVRERDLLRHPQPLHRGRHRVGEEHRIDPYHDVARHFEEVALVLQGDQCPCRLGGRSAGAARPENEWEDLVSLKARLTRLEGGRPPAGADDCPRPEFGP